ncbi:hypothetical protein FNE59_20340 [Bacillus thuringiensis]|uniref:hypothetical protein n=1 Tax=Bacillus cereus group TaxID=86661 RepID=UPI0018F63A50|nr:MULTISPECIES: hypothetical protein [Bacillus cereus group]MBJ7935555.1 hypothetical protein [Bacillus cereus]MDR5047864.1 hypothetical protein [Bacillus thuringiensis]
MTDFHFLNLPTPKPILNKPDCNRMVAEKLGTTTRGCNCQSMLLLLIQNGEIKTWENITATPCHLIEMKIGKIEDEYASCIKDGEGIYTPERKGTSYTFDINGDFKEFGEPARYIETIKLGDKYFTKQVCDAFDEVTWEFFEDYNCPDELKELPTGIYRLLIEHACFNSWSPDCGYEGDGDVDYKLYTDIPLHYYWKYKEKLITEADPEAEELAARYIYLQEINNLNY